MDGRRTMSSARRLTLWQSLESSFQLRPEAKDCLCNLDGKKSEFNSVPTIQQCKCIMEANVYWADSSTTLKWLRKHTQKVPTRAMEEVKTKRLVRTFPNERFQVGILFRPISCIYLQSSQYFKRRQQPERRSRITSVTISSLLTKSIAFMKRI